MTTQENNIVKALSTAKEILTQMISQGLGDAKHVFVLSNVLSDKYNISHDDSMIVIEEALKIA